MKRAEQLVPLSHDHHQGLVVSQQALRLDDSASDADIKQHWLKLKRCIEEQAQHHFVIEEQYLLEPLAQLGGNDLMVQRIYHEHKQLCAFASQEIKQSLSTLKEAAALLKAHIKYEERELFAKAQEVFTTEQLDRLLKAHG